MSMNWLHVFPIKFYWNTAPFIRFHTVSGYFLTTSVELSCWKRDWIAPKPKILTVCLRKSLLIPVLNRVSPWGRYWRLDLAIFFAGKSHPVQRRRFSGISGLRLSDTSSGSHPLWWPEMIVWCLLGPPLSLVENHCPQLCPTEKGTVKWRCFQVFGSSSSLGGDVIKPLHISIWFILLLNLSFVLTFNLFYNYIKCFHDSKVKSIKWRYSWGNLASNSAPPPLVFICCCKQP